MSQILRRSALRLHELTTRRHVLYYLEQLNQTQQLSRTALENLQYQKLQSIVKYAYEYVPYYQKLFRQIGFHPNNLTPDNDALSKIPILTKEIIHENFDDLLTTEPARRCRLTQVSTSGSTGHPLIFMQDNDFRDTVTADIQRHLSWAGWKLGQKHAYIWGANFEIKQAESLRTRFIDWVWNRFTINAFILTEESMNTFAQKVLQQHPRLLFGYASSLYHFARFVRENPVYRGIKFNGVFSSAEVLLPEIRQFLEETFQCRVFDRYGSKELGGIACECHAHTGLHISAENNFVEIINNDQPATANEPGDIIVTNLNNHGMPFIRYKTGDVGRWYPPTTCPCGNAAPMLYPVEGRLVDTFHTCDGRKVWAGFAGAGYSGLAHPAIRQFQVVQKSLDLIVVRLVKTDEIPQTILGGLTKTVRTAFGDNVNVQFEFPTEIQTLPSGKHQYAVSELKE